MIATERFAAVTQRYGKLRIVVIGDFCLDRYLEIDPSLEERSIETGLPVHNVVRVRSQPGAAGTIVNNLVALGVGEIVPVGFYGEDGEGYELQRALSGMRGLRLDHFPALSERRTFTYTKPLLCDGPVPRELNRLDLKNWSPTPESVSQRLCEALLSAGRDADAVIAMDQVDREETGVLTRRVREALGQLAKERPALPIIADSRRGLRGWPAVIWKMNRAELQALGVLGSNPREQAVSLARDNGQPVFVTLAEDGIVAAEPDGNVCGFKALPVQGEIDIVGAGDAVTANLAAALAGGATLAEAAALANAAASVVIHQVGTTGSATVEQLRARLGIA